MENTSTFGALNYSIFFIYLTAIFGIGLLLAGKQKNTEDYFLAGRKMPWLIVAMSMFASLTSATSYMGIPGTAYRENIAFVILGFMSIIGAPIMIFLFYPFYRRLNVTTSYEYINRRYGPNARFATSGLFILARLGWLGVVIYSPALALSVVTGVNLYFAILIMGVLATAYTVLGGLSAVLWTDALQFTILVCGAIWVAVTLVMNVPNGLSGIMTIASESGHLDVFNLDLNIYEMGALAVGISYFLQILQDYGTDQVTVQRLMSTETFGGMAKATLVNAFNDLFIVSLLLFIGIGMYAFYQINPEQILTTIQGDKVLPFYIIHNLPNGVSGLLITAIFAAAMSSMDSGINSLSTVIVNDFIKPLRRKTVSEHRDVNLARTLTFSLGAFAIGVACFVSTIEQILKAASGFLGLFAAPILVLFILGILTRRANFKGWLVGTVVAVCATLWLQNDTEVHFIYYFPFCFTISLVFGYLTSVIIKSPLAPLEVTLWGRSELKQES